MPITEAFSESLTAHPIYTWTVLGVVVLGIVSFILLSFISAPYGRHLRPGWGPTLNATALWVIMEAPSPISFALVYFMSDNAFKPVPLVLLGLYMFHYLYQVIRLSFPDARRSQAKAHRHRPAGILSFNVANGSTNAFAITELAPHLLSTDWITDPRFIIGVVVFAAGYVINQQSDAILRNLRKPGESGYKIPQGGFYRWLSSPNYFGEIVEWIGFALAAWTVPAWVFAWFTATNLVPARVYQPSLVPRAFQRLPKKPARNHPIPALAHRLASMPRLTRQCAAKGARRREGCTVADKDSSSRKEPSDLFQVEDATPSIAPVDRIVLPPEEALKRRIRRFIAAGIAAVIFFFIAHLVLGWIHAARLTSALDEVINDSSPDTIDRALGLLRDDPNDSVRARLLATAALGGDHDKLLEAETLLSESPQLNDPDQRIARIYAFLAEGDGRAAHAEAERPAKYSGQADAFLRGRALTAIARGQWTQALPDAQKVVASRPGAPEPAALLAVITAQTEGPEAALAVLDEVGSETSATRIARARIVGLLQGNTDEALTLAEEVREDDDASAVHKAWSHLIAGVIAYRQGAIGAAYEHGRAAAEPELRVDEPLLVGTAQLLLTLGRAGDAKKLLQRLSSGPSADLFTRAHVIAWWYAQSGDMRAGLATLSGAGFGPEKEAKPVFRALVIAELLKSSPRAGERDRALSLYKATVSDADWGVAASTALANVLAEEGSTEEAIAVLQAALDKAPNHLTLVDAAAQAFVSAGRLSDAEKVTQRARCVRE